MKSLFAKRIKSNKITNSLFSLHPCLRVSHGIYKVAPLTL